MLVSFRLFFFKQKTAYDVRISDWRSDVCSSDLFPPNRNALTGGAQRIQHSGICPIHSSKLSPPDPEDLACGITDTLSIGRSKWKYSAAIIAAIDPQLAWRPVPQARCIFPNMVRTLDHPWRQFSGGVY